MPSAAARPVTRTEFEESTHAVERLSMRVEVLTNDVHRLTNQVGDIAEAIGDFRADVEARFSASDDQVAALRTEFQTLTRTVQDGHAAIISAVQQLHR